MNEFSPILVFIIGGLLFTGLALLVGRMVRPRRPNPEKLSTYESGEDPVGGAWIQFNSSFYVIALIFLLFEVEVVLFFPWAVVFDDAQLQQQTNNQWGLSLIHI